MKSSKRQFGTVQERLTRARKLVRRYIPAGVPLVDELISERRAEFERERSGQRPTINDRRPKADDV